MSSLAGQCWTGFALDVGLVEGDVAAAEEHERIALVVAAIHGDDAADEDPVVAAFMNGVDVAAECGRAPFEPRAAVPVGEREGGRLRFLPGAGEVRREVTLLLREDVDRKDGPGVGELAGARALSDADEDERRRQRNP